MVSKALDSVKAAFLYLLTHTLFHYIVENAASIIEILLAKPDIYKTYFSNVYAEVFNSPECIEESLANAYLFERDSICHIDKNYLKEALSRQGPGYRDFVDYTDSRFRNGARKLMCQIHYGKLNPNSDAPLEQIIDVTDPIDYSHGHRVPVWLHRRAKPLHRTKNILGNM